MKDVYFTLAFVISATTLYCETDVKDSHLYYNLSALGIIYLLLGGLETLVRIGSEGLSTDFTDHKGDPLFVRLAHKGKSYAGALKDPYPLGRGRMTESEMKIRP